MKPLSLFVTFWGEKHRTYFLGLCLASLMGKGNLPYLKKEDGHKFLVCCPKDDWDLCVQYEIVRQAAQHIQFEWIARDAPVLGSQKCNVMSQGHKIMADQAWKDQSIGAFLTPDMLIAEDFVKGVVERFEQTTTGLIQICAMRHDMDGILFELAHRGLIELGNPISLPKRHLAGLAAAYLHSETQAYEYDAPWFGHRHPVCPYWRVSQDGILVHSFSWLTVIDYAALKEHDARCLETWTVDGNYAAMNAAHLKEGKSIHVVTDSDDLFLCGITSHADLHYERRIIPLWSIPFLGETVKRLYLRCCKWSERNTKLTFPHMDGLKRQLFAYPVRIHGAPLTRKWARVEKRAKKVIAKTASVPTDAEETRLLDWLAYWQVGEWEGPGWLARTAIGIEFIGKLLLRRLPHVKEIARPPEKQSAGG
jgi:hypothetical protein